MPSAGDTPALVLCIIIIIITIIIILSSSRDRVIFCAGHVCVYDVCTLYYVREFTSRQQLLYSRSAILYYYFAPSYRSAVL